MLLSFAICLRLFYFCFSFAAPHCEAQEVARSSPAMEPPQNHGYVEMANVFRDPRGDVIIFLNRPIS